MSTLAELRRRYLLTDWEIAIRDEGESSDGRLGHVDIRAESREATVTLYAADILEHTRRFPNESRERTLEHEFCEIAVAEECAGLPEYITEHPDFMDFRDRMAERLRLCVTRAGGIAFANIRHLYDGATQRIT